MRIRLWALVALCFFTTPLLAEDKPNPEQLKKAYDDALVLLKIAQDSKADLARENEKLTKQVDELKKQVATAQGQIDGLKRQVSDEGQKTFLLRSYQAAWQSFLKAHPDVLPQWRLFLGEDALAVPQVRQPLIDPNFLSMNTADESSRD